MTPGSFDAVTAREIVGDSSARVIEEKARKDADTKSYDPPPANTKTYWDSVQAAVKKIVYDEQYDKRVARNERKANHERSQHG